MKPLHLTALCLTAAAWVLWVGVPGDANASDVVLEMRFLGLDSVENPLAVPDGMFHRHALLAPANAAKVKKLRDGFFFLRPTDPTMSMPSQGEPVLVINDLNFNSQYVMIGPGQLLTIDNRSVYDLTFTVEMSGNSVQIAVKAKGQNKVAVAGTDQGMVTCHQLPHMRAFIFRSGPGYIFPLSAQEGRYQKTILNDVRSGVYQLLIWMGSWWRSQALRVSGESTVLRVDLDASVVEDSFEAVVNPPEMLKDGMEMQMTFAPEEMEQQAKKRPGPPQGPAPEVEEEEEAPEEPPPPPEPRKKAPPKRDKAVTPPAPGGAGGGFSGFKEKSSGEEEKKPEEQKPAQEKKSGGSLFKIKRVDGE